MLTIIGCGNLNRSDDAAGVWVARRLAQRFDRHPVPNVRVFDAGTGGMEVMFQARGSRALVVVDACVSGSEPGAVFEVPGAELEAEHEPSFGLHDFRWDHALHAGRKIFRADFPTDVAVYLIEAKSTALGLELSPEVERGISTVYGRILDRVARHAAARHAPEDLEVVVERGVLSLEANLFDRYFREAPAVAIVEREGALVLLPLVDGYGGTLVKRKNRAGDRSIEIAEFMRRRGLDEWTRQAWPATWSTELGGLAITPRS